MPNAMFRSLTGKVCSAITRARRAAAPTSRPAPVGGEALEDRRLFALAVTPLPAATPATTLGAALLVPNSGITITGGTYVGQATQGGTFTGFDETGPAGQRLRIVDGVLLTTGSAPAALGPNNASGTSTVWDAPGDPDLDVLTERLTSDANTLTLTFTAAPGTQSVMFDFIFGSEEYPEFAGSNTNDVFAAYLDGELVNLDVNGRPITANSALLRVANPPGPTAFNLEYDGFTPRVRTQAPLNAALTTHTLKFVIADNTTPGIDSGVFLSRLQGTTAAVTAPATDVPTVGTLQLGTQSVEVSETAGAAGIVVNRVGGTSGQVQVNYAITAGSATDLLDFTPLSGTVFFADGQTSQPLAFPVIDDLLVEGDETVQITLSSPVDAPLGATTAATVTILDNEQAISFASPTYAVPEPGMLAGVVVARSGAVDLPATVNYATADVPGGAVANQDYVATAGTILFAAGQRTAFVTVPILDDFVDGEPDESFSVVLSQPNGAGLGTNGTTTVTIANVDRPPSIYDITAFAPRGRIEALYLKVNDPVLAARAIDPANYDLYQHAERRFNAQTARRRVPLRAVDYDTTLNTLVMRPVRALRNNVFYEVTVRGSTDSGIRGANNDPLDGNFDRQPDPVTFGEDFVGYFGRGTRLSYFDRDGDRVRLGTQGGGVIEVFRDVYREPRTVRHLGPAAGAAVWGIVTPGGRGSNGQTTIGTLILNGAQNFLPTPPFIISGLF